MARRIAQSTLNASTLDIMNVIRANASVEYQSSVPHVTKATEIPKVGEIIYGTPALANQFINALVNRIAIVSVQTATFNNPYSRLKKGYLEFGETIEDIFVGIANAVEFDVEKAAGREFKRTLPDVKSAFHTMNWRVMYPVTIQDEDLKLAFLSADGIRNLISKIVYQIYTASEYDEFLLFKYIIIKSIAHGKTATVSIGDGTTMSQAAVAFRGTSNLLTFMSSDYSESAVKTTTPKSRQVIFMDSMYNAQYDVEVLAAAFNMDKAEFTGSLYLMDDWTKFDNERFAYITSVSDAIEEVTDEELTLMSNVKAVMVDENWFQIYDNLNKFTEKYVANGLYWNYFYHTWKTVSRSPFANAVAFVTASANIEPPTELTVEIDTKSSSENAVVLTFSVQSDEPAFTPTNVQFEQTEVLTQEGIAVQKFGAVIIPQSQVATEITLVATYQGTTYTAATTISGATVVGDTVKLETA